MADISTLTVTWQQPQTYNGINVLAGGGVKFPATQIPSADVNVLDDYEEGTFTPGIAFAGASVGVTYGTQTGKYTKIGRLVTIEIQINLTAKGSSTGTATVTGLPFAAGAAPNAFGAWLGGTLTAVTVPLFGVNAGTTTITLYNFTANTFALLSEGNFNNTSQIFLGASYAV